MGPGRHRGSADHERQRVRLLPRHDQAWRPDLPDVRHAAGGRTAAIDVQARISPADGGAAAMETLRVATTPQPLFYRRGPTTANRQVATGDLRFTRADRVHLELPVGPETKAGAGRLLDRTGSRRRFRSRWASARTKPPASAGSPPTSRSRLWHHRTTWSKSRRPSHPARCAFLTGIRIVR